MKSKYVFGALLLLAAPALASLVEEELRVSRDLQSRLQTVLDHVLGEGRSTVLVNVTLDLTDDMKAKLDRAMQAKPGVTVTNAPAGGDEDASDGLPGFPPREKKSAAAPPPAVITVTQGGSWDPQVVLATGVRVKKMFVKVLLDKRLPPTAEETVKAVVGNFAGITPSRGDVFQIGRIRMPTLFEQALQNPALISPILQKAATLTVVMLTAMCFFVLGLAALSTMRRSVDKMASAIRTVGAGPALNTQALPADQRPGLTGGEARAALPSPAALPELTFDVPADKVGYLLEFLSNEELDRVAVVVQHLPPSAKSAFLNMLSPEQAGEVVVAMSQTSVTDPETLRKLKDDVERHVRGSSGGVLAVVDMLNAANSAMRKALMHSIAQKDPALGAAVRERIFLFEDLRKLGQADLSRVISQVQLQDLALSMLKEPPDMRERIKAALPELSWKVLQEETEHRGATASEQKVGEAQDRVVQTVYRMVREGQIAGVVKVPGMKA